MPLAFTQEDFPVASTIFQMFTKHLGNLLIRSPMIVIPFVTLLSNAHEVSARHVSEFFK